MQACGKWEYCRSFFRTVDNQCGQLIDAVIIVAELRYSPSI
jgi:hypothetical protein